MDDRHQRALWACDIIRMCCEESDGDLDAALSAAEQITNMSPAQLADSAAMLHTLAVLDEGLAKMQPQHDAALAIVEGKPPALGSFFANLPP